MASHPWCYRGEFLHAWPQLERLRSHLPVTLTRGNSHFTGNSMQYDNARQVALLQGRVRGHIEAPKAHALAFGRWPNVPLPLGADVKGRRKRNKSLAALCF